MNGGGAFLAIFFFIYILVLLTAIAATVFLVISQYKLFVKAGKEGWKALIPGYGIYVLVCEIAGMDLTIFILHFVPFANIYARIVTGIALAKSFGKDAGFGVGIGLLPVVFFPWIGFSKTMTYLGPGGSPIQDSTNSLSKDWQNPEKPAGV